MAQLQVPYVVMHMRGDPTTMQLRQNTTYSHVIKDVAQELGLAAQRALDAGVEPCCLILDPGVPSTQWTLPIAPPQTRSFSFDCV